MECHCNCCGYDFFFEEGYNEAIDAIICPNCDAKGYMNDDPVIIETTMR